MRNVEIAGLFYFLEIDKETACMGFDKNYYAKVFLSY